MRREFLFSNEVTIDEYMAKAAKLLRSIKFGEKLEDGSCLAKDLTDEEQAELANYFYEIAYQEMIKSAGNILDAIISRITKKLVAKAEMIAGQKEIPVLQRLTLMMQALNVNDDLGHAIMEQVHKPQNALMHQKMQGELLASVNPLITGLIEEGIAEGICETQYPAEVVEMTLLYSNIVFDDLAEHSEEERNKKIAAFIYNLERLLGMKPGSMQAAVLPIFEVSV